MKVGYFEAMLTPLTVVTQDLEMMSLENEYGTPKEDQIDRKKRK